MMKMNEEMKYTINAMVEDKFAEVIKLMDNEGKFYDFKNSFDVEYCDAVVMLVNGDICPVFKTTECGEMELNPLEISYHDYPKVRKRKDGALRYITSGNIEEDINRYNKGISTAISESGFTFIGKYLIIDYREFDK